MTHGVFVGLAAGVNVDIATRVADNSCGVFECSIAVCVAVLANVVSSVTGSVAVNVAANVAVCVSVAEVAVMSLQDGPGGDPV